MKVLLFTPLLFLLSCNEKDKAISLVIDMGQSEVNSLNHIKRITNDTNVISYVDSLKQNGLTSAYEIKGALESTRGFYTFDSSLKKINIYIDSLKK